jgi:mannose-6-phosphate isomerase-like protein (cupin superfamily)
MYTSKPLVETIPLPEHSSFALREFKTDAFRSPLHFHPEVELTYIVSGGAKRVVGDFVGDFSDGDLVLIGPNLPHYCYTKEVVAGSCAHAVVLQFDEAFLGQSFF